MQLFEEDDHTWSLKELTVKNYGIVGSVLQKESYSRLSGDADIVLILYTANNFYYNEDYVGTLEENIQTIGQQGSQVFLLTYPTREGSEFEDSHTQANNYIRNTASSMNVPLIDTESALADVTEYSPEELFCADGVHLTELGYEVMGDYVAQELHQYYCNMY